MFVDYDKIKKYEESVDLINQWKIAYNSYKQVENSSKYDYEQKESCLKEIKKHRDNVFTMMKKYYIPEITEEELIKLAEFDEQVNNLADFIKKKKVSEDLKEKKYDLIFDIINQIKYSFIKMLEIVPKHHETVSKITLETKLQELNHLQEIYKTIKNNKVFNLEQIKKNIISDFDMNLAHKIAENDSYIENVNNMLNQEFLLNIINHMNNDNIITYGDNLVNLINYLQAEDCIFETQNKWLELKNKLIGDNINLEDTFSEVLFFIVQEIEKIKLRILGIKIAKNMDIMPHVMPKNNKNPKSCGNGKLL
jgi:hypothetical protein